MLGIILYIYVSQGEISKNPCLGNIFDCLQVTNFSDASSTELSSPRKRVLNVKLPVRERRRFWTDKETKWLKDGVKTYGEGNWAVILDAYNFVGRTSVHLKDKWRNLQKN